MKIKSDLFYKSFFISLIAFALIAAIIICNLYITRIAIEPDQRESNILIGLTHNGKLLSMALIHCNPKHDSITILPIPDNTLLSNGEILQNQYKSGYAVSLIDSIEDLTGAIVHRYIFLSVNAVASIVNTLGRFEYLIRYPFIYSNSECSGNTYMTGDLAKSMFLYESYDMTQTSISNIGESFLKNFLASFGNVNDIAKLNTCLNSTEVRINSKTNLNQDEMEKYCNFLARFSALNQSSASIKGETMATSSSLYFRPEQNKATKNIFK